MNAVKIDKTDTCEAHCDQGDFDMIAGPYPQPTSATVLDQAAMHSMTSGHTVAEFFHSDMHVRPVQ
jgi:hypothetical protein